MRENRTRKGGGIRKFAVSMTTARFYQLVLLSTFFSTFSVSWGSTTPLSNEISILHSTPLPNSSIPPPLIQNLELDPYIPFSLPEKGKGLANLSPLPSKFSTNGQFGGTTGMEATLPSAKNGPPGTIFPVLSPSLKSGLEHLGQTSKSLVGIHSNGIKSSSASSSSSPLGSSFTLISPEITSPTSQTQNGAKRDEKEANTTWRGSQTQFPPDDEGGRLVPPTEAEGGRMVPKTTTTTASSVLYLKRRPLPTPKQNGIGKKVKPQTLPPTGDSHVQFMYPEWLGSPRAFSTVDVPGNKTGRALEKAAEDGEELDYEAGSYEFGRGNQEESPWREVSYFSRNPLETSHSAPYEFSKSNQDAPERESNGVNGEIPMEKHRGGGPPSLVESDGLADVISRGRIDSVMYVYFGDKFNDYHREEIAGRIIQAVGGVVAAIAHVLTVLGAAKCIRKGQLNILPVQLHIGFALLISNLLLLLAVHATEPLDVCASVAVVLHYLHLVIGAWLLAHTVQTYRALRHHVNAPNLLTPETEGGRPQMVPFGQRTVIPASTLRYCVITWAAPFPFILMSYLAGPEGYETTRYCWMSIEKGMVVSFIVPVFLLIGLNTLLVILSLRHLLALRKLWEDPLSLEPGEEEVSDEKTVSSGIRSSAMLLPILAISWFLSVVALENPTSVFFQVAAATGNIVLSWLVMYFLGDEIWPDIWCPFLKRKQAASHLSSSIEELDGSPFLSTVQPSEGIQMSFDGEPLLPNTPSTSSSTMMTIGDSGGPSMASVPGPSRGLRWPQKNKSNWSRPGGNEIYELRHDAISTIYK